MAKWAAGQLPVNWAMKEEGMKIIGNVKMLQQQQQLQLLSFLIQKTHKNSQREREREKKKAPTPNIVLRSCANGVGKSCTKEKYAMVGFFLFTMDVVHFVPPPQKRKISTTLDLVIY